MKGIEVIFWVVLAVIWLISGSLIRRRSRKERERLQGEGEAYREPEEETMGTVREEVSEVLESLEVEEKGVPVSEQPPIIFPSAEELEIIEPVEVKEVPKMEFVLRPVMPTIPETEELEIELTDLETVGRGILISEILGPPRAKKPFRTAR